MRKLTSALILLLLTELCIFSDLEFKRGTAELGVDILPLCYTRMKYSDEDLRKLSDAGIRYVRFFNASKDLMHYKDYNIEYFNRLKKVLSDLIRYDLVPIISASGYYRMNAGVLKQSEFEQIFHKTLVFTRQVIPDDNFIIEIANECFRAPSTFKYAGRAQVSSGWWCETPAYKTAAAKPTADYREAMNKIGSWHKYMADFLKKRGFPKTQITSSVIDNENYPEEISTADMIIAGLAGDLKGESSVSDVLSSWHNIVVRPDIKGKMGLKRLFFARRLWKYHVTNDGHSLNGEPQGYYVIHPVTGEKVFRSSNKEELYLVTKELFKTAKHGIKGHKVYILYHDLPREIFKGYSNGGWDFDLSLIDWSRLKVMAEAYRDVFGRYPEKSGKYPEPECRDGDLRYETCRDGSEIITHYCEHGKWKATGNKCPPQPEYREECSCSNYSSFWDRLMCLLGLKEKKCVKREIKKERKER